MKYTPLLVIAAVFSSQALAHFPTLECRSENAQLTCHAGFSDGSIAYNEPAEVRDYDDNILSVQLTDDAGNFTIEIPDGEFYIVFNPGHEQPAEFDYAEL